MRDVGDVRAFDLSIPEGMLFENAENELIADKAKYQTRVKAILGAHGLDPEAVREGHFQRDPLVAGQWRFLYRVVEPTEPIPLALPPGEGG